MASLRLKLTLALSVVAVATIASPVGAAPADDDAPVAPVATTLVGTDSISDWGGGGDNAILGHALGQDLLSASIAVPGATADFTMEVSFLPSTGGIPEASRYTWDFLVDNNVADETPGKFFELDGKFSNYSRGICDQTSGQCPPPRDPGERPFFLRGNCTTSNNITTCQELALLRGAFNPTARTITVSVPVELLGLKPCTQIQPGPNVFGGSISANPSAYFSSSAAPLDFMDLTGVVEIPSDDPENLPCPEAPEEEF